MSDATADPQTIVRAIGRMKLCPADAVAAAQAEGSADAMLRSLVAEQHLTPFQADLLRKGETAWLQLGQYRPQYLIAAGSFARVFRGVDGSGKTAAIKVMRERWLEKPAFVELFRREGELGKRLTHKNIVPTYEVGEEAGKPYIAMEFVEGGNLRDLLKVRGKFKPADALRLAEDVCAGLEYAVKFGVCHRDLKATNVMVGPDGSARLIDFGLAGDESSLDEADMHTALEYMTIESAAGVDNDPRSDLYFLGTILFELISGEPPYPRTADRVERKRVGRYRDVPSLAAAAPGTPPEAVAVVDRLMQFDPDERFQSPADAREAIRKANVAAGGAGGRVAGATTRDGATLKTVLCVESRPKHQDRLRDYFTKHGFRIMLLGDADRALGRLETAPPDSVILMGDAVGDRVAEDAAKFAAAGVASVVVLGRKQAGLAGPLAALPGHGAVLNMPVTLRDLRDALSLCLEAA